MIRLKRLYAHDFKQLREIELRFPDTGRILIQGKNEAGKSTLFEAIFFALFGQALAAENVGRPNLDDLIGYEKNKARVELDLTVRGRLFRITRTLNRGRTNLWHLEIAQGEHIEEVSGNRAVNDRIVAELGFDAEALLNTCFVEQKKLEKLEGLTKARREESLSKLLNLERLLDLEEKLKLRGEDEKLLARLSKRVELARAQEQLPSAEDELSLAEGQLKLIELQEQVLHAADERRTVGQLSEQLQTMRARREDLRESVGHVDALDKARRDMRSCVDRFDLYLRETSALQDQRRELAEVERGSNEALPILELRARGLDRLLHHLSRLERVERARLQAGAELERILAAQRDMQVLIARRAELTAAITQHQARAIRVDDMLRDYDRGDALGEWAELAREVVTEASIDHLLTEKEKSRKEAAAHFRIGIIVPGVALVALVAATVFVPLALLLFTANPTVAAAAGGGLLVVDAALAGLLVRRALHLWNELERASGELGKAQGEASTRREMARDYEQRLNKAENRLEELGAPVPADPEVAQILRVEIARTLENKTRDELRAERDSVHELMNYARAQRDEVDRRIEALQPIAAQPDADRCSHTVAAANRILGRWHPLLSAQAAQLEVEPDVQRVRDERRAIESERKNWQSRIQRASPLARQIREGEVRIQSLAGELERAYEGSRALLNGATLPWDLSLDRSAYIDLGKQLKTRFEEHGGEQVRTQLNSLEKELGACEREMRMREQAFQYAVSQARAILQDLAVQDGLSQDPSLDELDTLAERLNRREAADRAELQGRVRALHQQVGALRDTRHRLEQELGLWGETVELAAAREEQEREKRLQEERGRGSEIVQRARRRIVQKVLPSTMEYMRRILPQLTRDRYHDAELDPETFKIKVWDERAGQSGAWKEKNIFSGGTKDQFSLALRLDFALATLPQERGASPGFIFLDEPLGSFDDDRASALLYLLTDGEIARAFDQIFLVSHVQVQESRFTHHIRLEDGRVVASDLDR